MQVSVKSEGEYAAWLRQAGFRATYGRVALLQALADAKEPMSAEALSKAISGKLDLANTYRALEALLKSGIVRRVDVGHQHAHYELSAGASHRHLFACVDCGARHRCV